MPYHFAKKIIWLWLVSLFVSTAGVSVKTIYCFCAGKTQLSFFISENGCDKPEKSVVAESCCHKNQTETTCDSEKSDDKKNCCTKTGSKFFKLKTEFESQVFSLLKIDFQAVAQVLPTFSLAGFFTENFSPRHFFAPFLPLK